MTEGQATTNNARVHLWDACDVDTETLWKAVKGVSFSLLKSILVNASRSTKFLFNYRTKLGLLH